MKFKHKKIFINQQVLAQIHELEKAKGTSGGKRSKKRRSGKNKAKIRGNYKKRN